METSQYQIIIINPGITNGNEAKTTLQCVVISPDEMNKFLRTVIVAPVTSDSESYPTRPKMKLDSKIRRVALDQIMTIEKQRVVSVTGELSASEVKKVKAVLKETFID